jgi:hypothetical protein
VSPVDGTPFGRYRLIELLGRGGMGEVWRAYDTAANNRTVAIKLLPPHLAADHTLVQRFRREADAAAQLNNPHIVPIHNYGEIDGRLYVDMRLIEGRDLQAVLAVGPLEPAQAVRIVEQVAQALHAAHKVGLVHRRRRRFVVDVVLDVLSARADRGQQPRHRRHGVQQEPVRRPVRRRGHHRTPDRRQSTHLKGPRRIFL